MEEKPAPLAHTLLYSTSLLHPLLFVQQVNNEPNQYALCLQSHLI